MLNVNDVNQIYLGCQGENLARTIVINVAPWLVAYPSGNIGIWHKRNGESVLTPTGAIFDPEAGTLTWKPTSTDTYAFGEGEAEIRLSEGSVIKKSRTVKTDVAKAVTGPDGTAIGSEWENYLDAIQRAAGVAIIKNGQIRFAINSAGHLILSYTDEVPIPADDDTETTEAGDITWFDKDLGPVDVYAEAVAAGYTGTKEEWLLEVGSVKENAQTASGAATAASGSATQAAGSATSAAASAAEAAQYTSSAVHTWLENNIDPDSGYALDRTLSETLEAAPADMVGDLKSALTRSDEFLREARDALSIDDDITENLTAGYRIKTDIAIGQTVDLTPAESQSFGYMIVTGVMPGDKFTITGLGGETPRLWAFVDKDNKMISFADANVNASNLVITAPAKTYKLVINANTGVYYKIIKNNKQGKVANEISDRVDPIDELLLADKSLPDGYSSGYIKLNTGIGSTISLTPVSSVSTVSKVISTEVGKKYKISGYSGDNPRLWGFIDGKNKLLSVASGSTTITNAEITAPTNAVKLVVNSSLGSKNPTILIELNAEYVTKIATTNNSFNDSLAKHELFLQSDAKESTQLFNYKTVTLNKEFDTDGTIIDNAYKSISDFIPVVPGEKYTVRSCVGKIAYFNDDKIFTELKECSAYNQDTRSFTMPDNIKYVRIQLNNDYAPWMMTTFSHGGPQAKNEIRYGYLLNESMQDFGKWCEFSAIPVPTEYSAIGTKAVDGTQDFDDNNPSVSAVYDAYDALMEANPNYITKEDLGTDESGDYHIYAYYFTPESMDTRYTAQRKPYPKINIGAGIHGNGDSGDSNINLFCLYYFFKSLCDNWRESAALEYFRWNMRFAVIPIQNPWGFENKKRYNYNHVDINRNFSIGWSLGDPESASYGGAEPMSEDETNIIADFENANKDAIMSIDIHSNGGVPDQDKMCYCSTYTTSETFYIAKSIVTKMSHVWDSQNITGLTQMNFHGWIDTPFNGWGTRTGYVNAQIGTPALTLEGFKNFDGSSYTNGSAQIVKMVADQLGYYLLLATDYFKRKLH